jgi:hypothetical protein
MFSHFSKNLLEFYPKFYKESHTAIVPIFESCFLIIGGSSSFPNTPFGFRKEVGRIVSSQSKIKTV